jgi:hypothetical protein
MDVAREIILKCPLWVVISIDRRNTLIFVEMMEWWNEVQAPDIFYS